MYVLTETYMISDKSQDFKDTWEFLDRRIEDTQALGKVISGSKGFTSSVSAGIGSIFGILRPGNLSMDDSEMLRQQEELKKKD